MLRNEVSRIFIEIYICQFHHQRYINPESLSHYGSKATAPHKPRWGRLSVWNLLNVTPLCSTSDNAWGTGLKNDFTLNITLESLLKSLSSKTLIPKSINMYKVYVIKVTESTRGHWHTYVHGSLMQLQFYLQNVQLQHWFNMPYQSTSFHLVLGPNCPILIALWALWLAAS